MRKKFIVVLLDHLLLVICFVLVVVLRGQQPLLVMAQRHEWLLILLGIHFFTALLFEKYSFSSDNPSIKNRLYRVLYANLAYASLVGLMFFLIGYLGMSRILFFGTLALTTILELVIVYTAGLFFAAEAKDLSGKDVVDAEEDMQQPAAPADDFTEPPRFLTVEGQAIKQSILEEIGPNVFDYLKKHVPLGDSSVILSVNNRFNILNLPSYCTNTIVNLQRVNDHRYVNKFFEAVNFRLPPEGIYAGLAETKELRKKRFFRRYSRVLGFGLYCFDYLWNRVSPKLPVVRKFYFLLTKGKNRVMSRAEVLGRLYSCGFVIVDESIVDDTLFFVVKKKRMPYYDNNPTYGPLIKLSRVGKDGKLIGVYKMRTMHPYAEYLQHYVHKLNKLKEGGKFENDFRITTVGCLMRKLWIDELPMLVNWLKGDLKLVGVRPLSEHYFKLYSQELRNKRINHKPGLVPPFYADIPATLDEIMASELKYLDAYEKHPFRTDWRYFWKAFVNIVFRKARSN
jgi:lipopolysaccharide/colanic/teichoic acid biosynthesis glycosyltransferase